MTKPVISEMKDFKLDDTKIDIIKSVCPINVSVLVPKTEEHDDYYGFIGRVTWLCKTVFDKMFCLTSNYVAETDEDEEFIISLPLLEDKNYLNFKIASDMLMGTLPHYLTDLEFSFDSDSESIHNASDAEIYCVGLEYVDDKTVFHKITVSPEVFGVLKFFDEYMLDGVSNLGNLKQSILAGPIEDNDTSIFVVDKINVLNIVKIGNRKSTAVAVKMEVSHVTKSEEKYTLLVPFDLGQKYPKKKFGKTSIDDITAGYLSDPNNFVDNFIFMAELNNVEYLFLRCSNKGGNSKLFAISNEIRSILIDSIENYDANNK